MVVAAACGAGPGDAGEPDIHRLPLDSLVLAPGVEHRGYRVTLIDLTPAPRAGVVIPPDEYRATVRVEAVD